MTTDEIIDRLVEALEHVPAGAPLIAQAIEDRERFRLAACDSRLASEAELAAAAVHEASHCVCAIVFNRPVQCVQIFRRGGGATFFDPSPAAADPFIVAVVALSGPIGSLYGGDDRSVEQLAASGDVVSARAAISKCRGDPREIVTRTVELVTEHWVKIERVARALRERGELRGMAVVYSMLGVR
jgi:hypothetical protein